MFSIHGPCARILEGRLGSASTIHFNITLPYSNEKNKVRDYLLPCVIASLWQSLRHGFLNKRKAGGFNPRASGFNTDYSTMKIYFLLLGHLMMAIWKKQLQYKNICKDVAKWPFLCVRLLLGGESLWLDLLEKCVGLAECLRAGWLHGAHPDIQRYLWVIVE